MYVHAMQCDDLQPLNKNPSLRLLHLKPPHKSAGKMHKSLGKIVAIIQNL